ncbi:hypothetical protein Afil01_17470 [Actinorhabdospora filicis]|uniref:Pyrrolo-quinoline quinone repeat domain-containing protein n=1 Tax=Actinorhabdospora filicis TaxID=1785913 RepID=A0A9W6W9T3_9ACTN|nr:Hsp70 family protein [Actinorhabdospora filicis]GLZ76940.1 hypothetical protein Afil01_17470 [Actinorhabdospora filicis]
MASPQPGYLLSVDLGTSNTVAVIRWPDGRVRPLLVDGTHVMPSSVFLDEGGHIHVGRDAQRLALTAPGRYEPNPKQRTEEDAILLGEREVPVVALLTAILRAVADKAIEAVGFLPPAVLTHPAKWTARRRDLLQDAAAKAGFPPVRLVPEPIAAAHYFAAAQPIPPNGSVAVFDFGGGTLDVAVVRNNGVMGFGVLGDGGLSDLGGLDVDAALVAHLGRTIAHNAPELWQRLQHPESQTDKRSRRQFWDDVRGAKEMLSRTTVAPVPVPTVDVSLHLTRDELEGLATPLLDRAIGETVRVIQAAGLEPAQLRGLYLVGGASRIPLVARLLHQRLGIAPIVLEQPELPVAEGALATQPQLPSHNPMTLARTEPPVSPAPPVQAYTPPNGADGHFQPPQGTDGPFLPPTPARPLWKRPPAWIAAAVVLLLVIVGGWWLLRDPYPQLPMHQLAQVGATAPLPQGATGSASAELEDGVAYFFSPTGDGKTGEITAVDTESGKEQWRNSAGLVTGSAWGSLAVGSGFILVRADNSGPLDSLYLIDPDTGKVRATIVADVMYDRIWFLGDRLIVYRGDVETAYAYDTDGKEVWNHPWKGDVGQGGLWSAISAPANTTVDSAGLFYGLGKDKTVTVWKAEDGSTVASASILKDPAKDKTELFEGKLYIASGDTNYGLTEYDGKLTAGATTQVTGVGKPDLLWGCGEERLCLREKTDAGKYAVAVFDLTDKGPVLAWHSSADQNTTWITGMGEHFALYVDNEKTGPTTTILDADFKPIGAPHAGTFSAIDSGSLLLFPGGTSTQAFDVKGLGALDGVEIGLGQIGVAGCVPDQKVLACHGSDGYTVWRFRDA